MLTRDRLVSAVTSSAGVQPFAEQFLLWVGQTLVLFGPTLAVLTYLEQIGKASAALLLNVTFFAVVLGIALLLPQPVRSSTLTQLIAVSNVIGFAGVQFSAARLLRRPKGRSTLLDIHAPQLDIGALAIRAYTAGDHNAVLDLFEGPAFYFRTYRPDLLSEDQITALVGDTDLVCRYDGAVVGLFAADPLPAGYPVTVKFTSGLPTGSIPRPPPLSPAG